MTANDIAPIVSTLFFVMGGAIGLGRWLWNRIEKRMTEGDAAVMAKMDKTATSIADLAVRVSVVELAQAEQKGKTDVLVQIYASRGEPPA